MLVTVFYCEARSNLIVFIEVYLEILNLKSLMNNLKAFQDYLQHEKKYSIHTVIAYVNDLLFFKEFIKNNFDNDTLEVVNYSMIRSWIVALVDGGISNSSVNRKIASLKSFYKFLLKTKQIESSPLLKHKSLKTPKKIQIPFSEKELDNVLNYIHYPEHLRP